MKAYKSEKEFLANYDIRDFDVPLVTVDMAILTVKADALCVLAMKRNEFPKKGRWALPGGFIEPDETIEQAVVREVQEEAGVVTAVEAVLGLRSRYDPASGNGIYVILLLRPISGEPRADGHETDHAEFFTLDQISQLTPLPPVNWEIAQRVLAPDRRLLGPKPLSNLNGAKFTLFVG